jgi:MFS family permease
MSAPDAAKLFQNYTKVEPRVPRFIWTVLRLATLVVTFAIAGLLIYQPELGLKLFWGLAIPAVPAVLILAPGLWRQVCPMAFLNQIPRLGGFSREKDLPEAWRNAAFGIAVTTFFAAVALRVPMLNHDGQLVAIGVLGVLLLAFIGGLVFKGRSGWCGTFCPLGPIQRNYGHAPLLMVRNGYCSPCLGCQKNCYDFNPRAAIFADMYDEDPRYSGQRRFFMAMMPGMILGYFMQGPSPAYGEPLHLLILRLGRSLSSRRELFRPQRFSRFQYLRRRSDYRLLLLCGTDNSQYNRAVERSPGVSAADWRQPRAWRCARRGSCAAGLAQRGRLSQRKRGVADDARRSARRFAA